jgi:uncharacterized protein with GYD domain
MPVYMLATRLSPDATKRKFEHYEEEGHSWLDLVKRKCPEVKFLDHYAILGPWDFIDIFEAPNEEVAAKVSMITQSCGASRAESWTAIPYRRLADIMKELG